MKSSISNLNSDEPQWLIQIRENLKEEHGDDENDTISIPYAPKTLMYSKPEAYIPQQLSIGPYHYMRPELYDSQRYKMAATKRTQRQLNSNYVSGSLKFEHLVHNHLIKFEQKIRSCYGYLDIKPNTLTWIVAVDASFLLDFLQVCAIRKGISPDILPITTEPGRRKSSDNAILRDIMMLENQVPLFILRKILEIQCSSLETADCVLNSMLIGLFKEISPIKMNDESFLSIKKVVDCAHLLDFVYHMLVPSKQEHNDEIHELDEGNDHEPGVMDGNSNESFGNTRVVIQLFDKVWKFLISKLKPVAFVGKLPWKTITSLPGFSLLRKPIENLNFSRQDKEDIKPKNDENKSPLMEEINIPSLAELYKSGVRFLPTNGNIETIRFDEKKATLHLPILNVDVHSDIVFRNLVAYEASTASGPLVFTRFTELMCGIIDTEKDARLLREGGIIMNHFKTDKEVANRFNGMSRAIKLTKVPVLDKMIEDVNKFYNRTWWVKLKKIVKRFALVSWPFVTILAAILLLLMTGLEAYCAVYSCARHFRVQPVDQH